MTIEQVLMRQMKVSGGLTHGRGMTDNATRVASLPACTELINQFEEFCDVAFLSGEQHVELRESRINRDISDVDKLAAYLNVHQPSVKLNGEEMLNHTLLTNRILCMIKNENDLARFITYEWAVYQPSLFYENGMLRKTLKSKLADSLLMNGRYINLHFFMKMVCYERL